MIKTVFLIIISFFAVIGFIECVLGMLETVSISRYKSIDDIMLRVSLSGSIENPTFLLNTLLLQAERIRYKNSETRIQIIDCGLDECTYSEIQAFCLANDNITMEKPQDV